jgi:hypothetical protein
MGKVYLVLAYALVAGVFMLYAWVIHRRQRRLEKEWVEMNRERREP